MGRLIEEAILIVDSGATKAHWHLVRGDKILHRITSNGITPVHQTKEEMNREIKKNVYTQYKDVPIKALYFYGSGCIPEKIPLVKEVLRSFFPIETIEVYSDLIAAAHALCGHTAGIASILGTGSNSCEWDGSQIIKQVPPLGFILGDEGSGASLGKRLISDALKGRLAAGLKEALLEEYQLTPALVIEKVYRQPLPSRFLASFAPFLLKHLKEPTIHRIVHEGFSDFFERNVMHYDYQKYKVNFVGSIGWYFASVLREAANERGVKISKIFRSPMEGLISYYNV